MDNKILINAINTLRSCFVAPNVLDKKKLKDNFRFDVSMTIVQQAIKQKIISKKDFLKMLKEKK